MRFKHISGFIWNVFWMIYGIYWIDKGPSWWWLLILPVFIGASLRAADAWNKLWEPKAV